MERNGLTIVLQVVGLGTVISERRGGLQRIVRVDNWVSKATIHLCPTSGHSEELLSVSVLIGNGI